ncbi:hypothetical protein ACFSC4_18415 [Deinococcus malanensis]|uniref:hypothetical protein n=1 Tax=Deinococcus malanensis TaxID=1706855 RepID=UPI003629B3C8
MTTAPASAVWRRLQPHDRAWLMQLATFAEGGRIALVGGAVRDALLGHTPLDLDVVVEGTPVLKVAEKTGLPLTFHPAFQNATLSLPDGRSADLVQARRETYPEPGTNPVPHPGTLADDLRRRDFSLNALALLVRPDSEPAFLDEVSGLRDLEVRQLRPCTALPCTRMPAGWYVGRGWLPGLTWTPVRSCCNRFRTPGGWPPYAAAVGRTQTVAAGAQTGAGRPKASAVGCRRSVAWPECARSAGLPSGVGAPGAVAGLCGGRALGQ